MPRLRKISVDTSARRFIEGRNTARISRTPVFYVGETTDLEFNLVEWAGDGYRDVLPSANGDFKVRLGTAITRIADAVTFSYDPPPVIQAQATVVTALPSTVTLTATWKDAPTQPITFEVSSFQPRLAGFGGQSAAITATFLASVASYTRPAVTAFAPVQPEPALGFPGLGIFVAASVATFGATLTSTQAATFTVTTSGSSVSSIGISSGGSGYPNGTYALTFTGGTVTTAAQANAVASGGAIVSVTIVTGGSGYVTAPAASLFTPANKIFAVRPNRVLSTVNGRPRFLWHTPLAGATVVTLNLAAPDNTSTPPVVTQGVARLNYLEEGQGIGVWEVELVDPGYGYNATPAVTVPPTLVSGRRRSTSVSVSSTENQMTVTVIYASGVTASTEEGGLFPGAAPYFFAAKGVGRSNSGDTYDKALQNAELSAGTYPLQATPFTDDGEGSLVTYISRRSVPAGRSPAAGPQGTIRRSASYSPLTDWADVAGYSATGLLLERPGNPLTAWQSLYGRTMLFAVVPERINERQRLALGMTSAAAAAFNETLPERYAVVRVTFPPRSSGLRPYHVAYGDTRGTNSALALLSENAGTEMAAPGGGWFEPTIEFLDYGKGYQTKWQPSLSTNELSFGNYNLVPLSGLQAGTVLDAAPKERTVTAVTVGDESGYLNTIFSETATVITSQGERGIVHQIGSPGVGYAQAGIFTLSAYTAGGQLDSVKFVNYPRGYAGGTYALTFSGGSPAITASAEMVVRVETSYDSTVGRDVTRQTAEIRVTCAGSGYISVPNITAPAPSGAAAFDASSMGGSVRMVRQVNITNADGYPVPVGSRGRPEDRYALNFSPSPVSGGTAEGYFYRSKTAAEVSANRRVANAIQYRGITNAQELTFLRERDANSLTREFQVQITKQGYGYVTAPAVTAEAPRISGKTLQSVKLPSIFTKKVPAGEAQSQFAAQLPGGVSDVTQEGGDYASIPSIGLPDGTYTCTLSEAASDEQAEAQVELTTRNLVTTRGGFNFTFVRIRRRGYGYATAATVSAPSASGNIVAGVTLTNNGYWYQPGATLQITDAAGSGASAVVDEVSGGKIRKVTLLTSGSGYSASPEAVFSPAGIDPSDALSETGVRATLTVATSAANSVLGSRDEADAMVEIYEKDGAEEHVVAQLPVKIAKRVKET